MWQFVVIMGWLFAIYLVYCKLRKKHLNLWLMFSLLFAFALSFMLWGFSR